MHDLFENIPWRIRAVGTALASGASVALDRLHVWDGPYALFAGIALAIWFCLDVAWHLVNKWRSSQKLPPLVLEPSHFIALGFVIVAAGFIWQASRSNAGTMPKDMATKIDGLHASIGRLQTSFDGYVKPREITDAQRKTLVEFLLPRQHMSVDIVFTAEYEEAENYAQQIYEALRKADWGVTLESVVGGRLPDTTIIQRGLTMHTVFGSKHKGTAKAQDLLVQGFEAAAIPIMGTSGGANSAAGPEDATTILIGHRPMVVTNAGH